MRPNENRFARAATAYTCEHTTKLHIARSWAALLRVCGLPPWDPTSLWAAPVGPHFFVGCPPMGPHLFGLPPIGPHLLVGRPHGTPPFVHGYMGSLLFVVLLFAALLLGAGWGLLQKSL